MKPLLSALAVLFFLAATQDPRAFKMPEKKDKPKETVPAEQLPVAGSQLPVESANESGVASGESPAPEAAAAPRGPSLMFALPNQKHEDPLATRNSHPETSPQAETPQATGNRQPATEPQARKPATFTPKPKKTRKPPTFRLPEKK